MSEVTGRRRKPRDRRRPATPRPGRTQHVAATAAPSEPSRGAALAAAPLPTAAPLPPAAGSLRAVEPPSPGLGRYLGEVWRQRPAFLYFVRRYMRKRYGRTFLGYLWFFLPVLLPLFLGALVFGGIIGVSVPGVPYLLYFAVALGVWLFFSQTAYFSTRSLEITRNEVRRVYVPRLIPLTAAMTLPFVGLLIYGAIIACTTAFYVIERGEFYLVLQPATLLAPVGLVMLLVLAWACALWFSTLAPRARDVRRLASYVLGFWYFLTPVMYPIDEIPAGYQFLASLNPITAPIELVKEGLLDIGEVTALGLAVYAGALTVIAGLGLRIFLPKERRDVAFY